MYLITLNNEVFPLGSLIFHDLMSLTIIHCIDLGVGLHKIRILESELRRSPHALRPFAFQFFGAMGLCLV